METQNGQPTGAKPVRLSVSELEAETIRQTFTEDLLKTMRAVFFGLDVNEGDRAIIRTTFKDAKLRAILRRRFLPTPDRETPPGQVSDTWLGVEELVFGRDRDTIAQAVQYKAIAIEMTEAALALLENPDGPVPNIAYDPKASDPDGLQVFLLARNSYLKHIEGQLGFLWMIVNAPKRDPKSNAQDSAR